MPPEDIQEFIRIELAPDVFEDWITHQIVLTAWDNDQLVGYAAVLDTAHQDFSGSNYLSKFYLDPKSHGSGIATQLHSELLQYLPKSVAGLWLGTNVENTRAQKFYERLGYQQLGTRNFEVGDILASDYIYYLDLATA